MMPMYNNSSQPSQTRPQGHYHYHQGFGNYPVSCEHCPTPSPCYGSCIHSNFPVYNNAYWPPCYPPQVPYHPCCMNHSGFQPHASHATPFHPPPFYAHQPFPGCYRPEYDSEKDVPGKRQCANFSPQMCYSKNDRGVVIEEHEPENERRNHGDQGEAVLPVRQPACPYPILWIPHENARIQEHGGSLGSGSHDKPTADVKAPENMKVQKADPKFRNGFFPFDEATMKSLVQNQDRQKMQDGKTKELPFDISKLKLLLEGPDGKQVKIQKNKEESGQLPYPIFWVPSHGEQGIVGSSENKEGSNEGLSLKSFRSDSQGEGKDGNFENKALSAAEEKSSLRNIPVDNHLQEPRNIPVKLLENHLPKPTVPTKRIAKREPVENTKKEQPSSLPKSSRLPPVCLRVDPLPKRKNGGSKSLKAPRQKEQPLTSEETKVASSVSSKKAESRTVPEAGNVTCEEANKELKMSEGRSNATEAERESVESKSNLQEGAKCEVFKPCETTGIRERPVKKTFTEEEAARIIQSRYRGYDVRRWEPLKKLQKIVTVREQMGDVTRRVKAVEDSTDQPIEENEIIILGEMVMNLLLKLDSVQGLHPSIRDHRKSLARELSDIEDKLDSLRKKSSEEKEAVEEQVKITSETSDCPVNSHNQLAEENKMASDSNTEDNLPPSPEEQPTLLKNLADERLVAEAEEGTGLSETLATDPKPASETSMCEMVATSTSIPGENGEVEVVLPINTLAADGNEMTVMKPEEDKVKPPQLVQVTCGPGFEGPDNATGVSEAEANTSENEEKKGDNGTELPSEKDVELYESPVEVIDGEAETTAMDPEAASQEETNVDSTCEHSKGVREESSDEPQEEKEESPETEVIVKEQPPETEVIVKAQPRETVVIEHDVSEETKKLIEENKRFKETMETLVKAGKEQLEVISELAGRVKMLEKSLSQKKRTQNGRRKLNRRKHAAKPMSESETEAVL
uniref:BAG family molecular chaperone regulator 6 n=1 Tax=Noccaea caerulescens TaxID=107243 RepID=A0A1J3G5R2_NOCCA